jgi:hypothetical protein
MSIEAMTRVWKSGLAGNDLVIALALADHAHDDGSSVHPGISLTRRKTKLSRATIQRRLHAAVERGWLELVATPAGRPRVYRIVYDRLPPFTGLPDDDDGGPHGEAPPDTDPPLGEAGGASLGEAGGASLGEALTFNNHHKPSGADARERAGGARAPSPGDDPSLAVTPDGEQAWLTMRERLRVRIGAAAYASWISRLELAEGTRSKLVICAPSRFVRDEVEKRYGYDMAELARCPVQIVFSRERSTA